jgi:hypothetical protein
MELHIQIHNSLVLGILVLLYVASIVGVFMDAQHRGKSGILAALLVAIVCWPFGLIVWVFSRPQMPETADQKLRGTTSMFPAAFLPCKCGRHIPVEERQAGTEVTCVSCGMTIPVPALSELRGMPGFHRE